MDKTPRTETDVRTPDRKDEPLLAWIAVKMLAIMVPLVVLYSYTAMYIVDNLNL